MSFELRARLPGQPQSRQFRKNSALAAALLVLLCAASANAAPVLVDIIGDSGQTRQLIVRFEEHGRTVAPALTRVQIAGTGPVDEARPEPLMFSTIPHRVDLMINGSDTDNILVLRESVLLAIRALSGRHSRVHVHLPESGTQPWLVLSHTPEEDAALIVEGIPGDTGPADDLFGQLTRVAALRTDGTGEQLHTLILLDRSLDEDGWRELSERSEALGLTLHGVSRHLPPTCAAVAERGGVCVEAGGTNLGLVNAAQRISASQVVEVPCVPGDNHPPTLRLNLSAGGDDVAVDVDAARLLCLGGEGIRADTSAGSGRSVLPLIAAIAIALVALMLALLAAYRRRQRWRTTVDSDEKAEPRRDFSELERSPPVDPDRVSEIPGWARSRGPSKQREKLRAHFSETRGLHVVASDREGVRELLLGDRPLNIGRSGLVKVSNSDVDVLVQLVLNGGRVVASVEEPNIVVLRNGVRVRETARLGPGDELQIGPELLLEIREVSDDPTARSARHHRRAEWQIHSDYRSVFEHSTVGTAGLIIGREPYAAGDADVLRARRVMPELSNDHVELWVSGGHLYLRDLDSANGTWVNDRKVDTMCAVILPVNAELQLPSGLSFRVS